MSASYKSKKGSSKKVLVKSQEIQGFYIFFKIASLAFSFFHNEALRHSHPS